MITYVNTVLVGNGNGIIIESLDNVSPVTSKNTVSTQRGAYVIDKNEDEDKFRVGIVTKKNHESIQIIDGKKKHVFRPIIKWSNWIKVADVTSFTTTTYFKDTEDQVKITLPSDVTALKDKRIVVRLTFKDLPTRFRKWSESYEIVVGNDMNTADDIATAIADKINDEYKRARVQADAEGAVITLTAMPYDDDDVNDSLNWANKVRFTANMWMTDPKATNAFEYKNKYSVPGASIEKIPGEQYTASAKLVRDMEAQAMGYQGILNRGECTWPIIKPDMEAQLEKDGEEMKYDSLTLQFENTYNTADDLVRRTKQTLQVFDETTKLAALIAAIAAIVGENANAELADGTHSSLTDGTYHPQSQE